MVTRVGVETEHDKAIDVLAKSKVLCEQSLLIGNCTRSQCVSCEKFIKYNRCYEALDDCSQLAVDERVLEYRAFFSYNNSKNRSNAAIVARKASVAVASILSYVAVVSFLIFIIVFILGCMSKPQDVSVKDELTWTRDKGMGWLYKILEKTHDNVCDMNKDGLLNCIDFAVTFKIEWDNDASKYPFDCEIVRNVNSSTGMNHLFVRCRYSEFSDWVYVEPQARHYNYNMEHYWGSKYDKHYNILGETDKWLRSCK